MRSGSEYVGSSTGHPLILTKSRLTPVVIGLVLLVASGFKAYELATEPLVEKNFWTSRGILIGVVEFELALGLWLLSGYRSEQGRFMALGAFGVFSLFTLARAINGEASCGCFGKVSVNPWYTLSFDLAALVALTWRQTGAVFAVTGSQHFRAMAALFIFLIVGVPAGIIMTTFRMARVTDEGDIIGKGRVVLLEPENWTGRRFPLRKYVDIGDVLMHGRWIVLLYRHDCSKCQEEAPKFRQRARAMAGYLTAPRVALIEMPPYGNDDSLSIFTASEYRMGHLSNVNDWFVKTPATLYLVDGVVRPVAESDEW